MTDIKKQKLGQLIRNLMEKHGVTGRRLSERLEVSKTTVSKILTGKTRPKQDTFSLICIALCHTDEEKNSLIEAYTGVRPSSTTTGSEEASLEHKFPARQKSAEELLKKRSTDWAFEEKVANELHLIGGTVKHRYHKGDCGADFYIEHKGKSIAVECRAEGFEEIDPQLESLMRKRILKLLGCDAVFTILPDESSVHNATLTGGAQVYALRFLKEAIEGLS